ncbi:hypothetical protein KL86CLO1_11481 [uncultured Eubacteriales bacterium]|uniref:Uncharacterized protein n=1 Tax=uncultured Eubacteriales bacterium TaxID=172733 RepID=A0A212JPR5_9FIRM|nr:hypothetical protein KL86CLO1_11481 [uncultured Eubacteriales bacterium]
MSFVIPPLISAHIISTKNEKSVAKICVSRYNEYNGADRTFEGAARDNRRAYCGEGWGQDLTSFFMRTYGKERRFEIIDQAGPSGGPRWGHRRRDGRAY